MGHLEPQKWVLLRGGEASSASEKKNFLRKMEKKMETTIMGLYRVYGLGYRDNGKENGNYCITIGYYPRIMENQMEQKMENEMEAGAI